jgi:redox-sensitive bicupin YhaK (pirin superfamily)
MVGPFIFFDHFGPAEFRAGAGLDVRPHPHIGLSTVSYLFDGEIMHRDSLGTAIAIKPGEVNWMTAGRGIVHSERTGPEKRAAGGPIHGLQMWVGLPADKEEMDPGFAHHETREFPIVTDAGKTVRGTITLAIASQPWLSPAAGSLPGKKLIGVFTLHLPRKLRRLLEGGSQT